MNKQIGKQIRPIKKHKYPSWQNNPLLIQSYAPTQEAS